MIIQENGNVSIPARLDVGTISATSYLNLPAADVLPITLDKNGFRVGINNTNPSKDLDVTGDTNVSGHLTVGGSIAGQLTQGAQPGITGVGVLAGLDVSGSADFSSGVSVGQDLSVTGTIFSSQANVLGTITVDRVTANHYDNLPVGDILPITLAGTKVGINNTNPGEALDVTGNIHATGSILGTQIEGDDVLATNVTTSTINAGTYLNLPPADVLPITLDKTNNRVGINETTPLYPLDVNGNAYIHGTLFGDVVRGDQVISTSVTTQALEVTTNARITSKLTVDTVEATTYLNLPPTNVLPITLDKTNNRVGINKTSPTQALDVVGDGVVSGSITAGTGVFPSGATASVIKSGTGTPEGSKVGIPGSLYLRTDGTASTALYVKGSGTGNTGWSTVGSSGLASALSFKLSADVSFTGSTPTNIMSFVLPTPGTWQITISIRHSYNSPVFLFLNEVAGDTSVAYPANIKLYVTYSSTSLSPQFTTCTYTTTIASKTVYLNALFAGTATHTVYANATYVYALKII